MSNIPDTAFPHIEITSDNPLIDAPLHIRLNGFEPDQPLTIRAQTTDDSARPWTSYATFKADAQGSVDLNTQKPLSGTYDDIDGMGLLWSMTPTEHKNIIFDKRYATPVTITFSVEGADVPGLSVERLIASSNITRTEVGEAGLAGTFFRPSDRQDRLPGILVLGGSGGGLSESRAALLASHGYATLALAYFRFEHLPPSLINIPLEYFATALQWLEAQMGVDGERLAVMGASKGGELALMLGATFPQIKAVVGYVPSSVVWAGIGTTNAEVMSRPSSWSYQGEPLPFVPIPSPQPPPTVTSAQASFPGPVSILPLYLKGLSNKEAVTLAAIAVENIQGPVLLISAQDDKLWPSTLMSEMVMQRLAQYQHPYANQHLSYAGAGHLIGVPYMPATVTRSAFQNSGLILAYGGSPRTNAFADRDSWTKVLAFLEMHLVR